MYLWVLSGINEQKFLFTLTLTISGVYRIHIAVKSRAGIGLKDALFNDIAKD